MSLIERRAIAGIVAGLFLTVNAVPAPAEPLLVGSGKFGVGLDSELSSRDVKTDGVKDRVRAARQSVELTYGLLKNMDFFVRGGLGKVTFEEADLISDTRPFGGAGIRAAKELQGGYFAGMAYQYQFGKVSKFRVNSATVTTEDQWTENDASLFVGTKDLIGGPEPDLRVYMGVRFSTRTDKLTPEAGTPSTAKQDSSIGEMIGVDYSDRKIFLFNAEVGTGDRSNVRVRFGLVF